MVQHKSCTEPTFDPTWYGPVSIVMASLETAAACICASIPIFWRPLLDSASGFLGQIFVTKEVKVTSQNRFELFGSSSSRQGFRDLELHGATLSRQYSQYTGDTPAADTWIARTWMDWAVDDGPSPEVDKLDGMPNMKTFDGWPYGKD